MRGAGPIAFDVRGTRARRNLTRYRLHCHCLQVAETTLGVDFIDANKALQRIAVEWLGIRWEGLRVRDPVYRLRAFRGVEQIGTVLQRQSAVGGGGNPANFVAIGRS